MSINSNENAPIYFVGGSKGGVGKSFLTCALLDYLRGKEQQPFLVESDTSNPDVWKSYSKLNNNKTLNLDALDGWMALVDLADSPEFRSRPIVINTGSRNNVAVSKFGSNLHLALEELNRRLIVLWVVDRSLDSLELLVEFREVMPGATIHVVKNGHWGEDRQFELYEESNLKKSIEEKGGKSILFPDVADRVALKLRNDRMPIEVAVEELPLSNRVELKRWRGLATKAFDQLIA